MKYLAVLKFIIFHNMVVLLAAMWTAIVAVVGSAAATWTAYSTGDFTLLRYWTVSAAVVTIAFALIGAMRGKAAADGEPAFIPHVRDLSHDKKEDGSVPPVLAIPHLQTADFPT